MKKRGKARLGYKITPIGEMPEGWEVASLSDLFRFSSGKKRPDGISPQSTPDNPHPVLGGNGIMGYSSEYSVEDEVIVIGRVGEHCGVVHSAPAFSWITDNALYTREMIAEDLSMEFFYHLLRYERLNRYKARSGQPLITQSILNCVRVPLPPLPEQRKIATILSTVDEAIQKTQTIIAQTQKVKQGLMQTLLIKGIGHTRFKVSPLGEIPEEWESAKLGEIAEEVYRYPTYYNIEYEAEGVPEVRGEMILKNGKLDSDPRNYRYISEETSQQYPRTEMKQGDFVMTVRGTIGKIAKVPKELEGANITANLMRISLNSEICYPGFYKQVLLSRKFGTTIDRLSPMTTIKTITSPVLKSIEVPLPPLHEQSKIASILSNMEDKIEREERYMAELERVKKGLMQVLLTGRVRVKVDT